MKQEPTLIQKLFKNAENSAELVKELLESNKELINYSKLLLEEINYLKNDNPIKNTKEICDYIFNLCKQIYLYQSKEKGVTDNLPLYINNEEINSSIVYYPVTDEYTKELISDSILYKNKYEETIEFLKTLDCPKSYGYEGLGTYPDCNTCPICEAKKSV